MSEFPEENNTSNFEDTKETPPQAPASTPDLPPARVVPLEAAKTQGTVATVVLQWLTYAFLGWLAISLVWLAAIVFDFLFNPGSNGMSSYDVSYLALPLSAAIAFGIASVVTDLLYSRREPSVKERAAKVIAIFYVVFFALVGAGFLVALIYNLVSQLLGLGGTYNSSSWSDLIVSGLGVVLFGLLIGRIVMPVRKKSFRISFWAILAAISVGLVVGASIGPAMNARRVAQDSVIESGLISASSAVNSYAGKHDKLPASLNDISIVGNNKTKELIQQNAIRYTANTSDPKKINTDAYAGTTATTIYYYKLCATFKTARNTGYGYSSYDTSLKSPSTSPNTSYHEAGEQCYDLQTDNYYGGVQGAASDLSVVQ